MTIEDRIEEFVNMYARPKSELTSSSRIIRESVEIQRARMTADLKDLIRNAVREKRDRFLNELHERAGLCGHCRKRSCEARKSNSYLPEVIDTNKIIDSLNKVIPPEGGE